MHCVIHTTLPSSRTYDTEVSAKRAQRKEGKTESLTTSTQ